MDLISSLNCPELTAADISNLNQKEIKTVIDFLSAPRDLVISVIECGPLEYKQIRDSLLSLYQRSPLTLRQITIEKQLKSTGIASFDAMLMGGLSPGDLIQIYGLASSGKTQLCMFLTSQFCRDSNVIYFDLKNDFYAGRLRQLCGGEKDYLDNVTVFQPANYENCLSTLDRIKEDFIGGIDGFYCNCRLLVIDSVPMVIYPVTNQEAYSWRFYLEKLLVKVQWLAENMNLSVILVNHAVTPRSTPGTESSKGEVVKAALGKYWESRIPIRIQISKTKVPSSRTRGVNFEYYTGYLEKCNRGAWNQTFNYSIRRGKLHEINSVSAQILK